MAAWDSSMPGRASRYGTRFSNRANRSPADPLTMNPRSYRRLGDFGDLFEAADDGFAHVVGLEHGDVGAVADEPGGEAVGFGVAHLQHITVHCGRDLGRPAPHPGRAAVAHQDPGGLG